MTAVRIPSELTPYLELLGDVLERSAPIEAVYLIGSAASGAYEHGRSDVDVIAVTSRSLSHDERRTLAAAVEVLPVPARKLELVVYPRGSDSWEINLNTPDGDTAEHLGLDPDLEPSFWFVVDRAIAAQHALPLVGPEWEELFAPESHEAIQAALTEADAFDGWDDPRGRELAAARSRAWRETGRWISKPEAQEWIA
ncbi:MAG TPA: nucleotidyltransferase domain-containing protein [Gaiellaceae bacterium]|nr:nucleotidyltransferase domain-containing protein [Gaiellaceae bacterium]